MFITSLSTERLGQPHADGQAMSLPSVERVSTFAFDETPVTHVGLHSGAQELRLVVQGQWALSQVMAALGKLASGRPAFALLTVTDLEQALME